MSSNEKNINTECQIFYTELKKKEYHIYLNDCITDSSNYIDLFKTLTNTSKDDVIFIHLNTYGGELMTTISIINAMKNCQATIITIIDTMAYSAGSMIFLAGHIYKVTNFSRMMCHYYSSGCYGKGHEIKSKADFEDEYFKNFYKTIYRNFLSPQEIEDLIKGKDFWFNGKEIDKRLRSMVSKNKKETKINHK